MPLQRRPAHRQHSASLACWPLLGAWLALTGCSSGVVDPGADDSGQDAGASDGVDAGADAGSPDAGFPDAGSTDSGTPDGGRADAGSTDGGRDAGPVPDAGPGACGNLVCDPIESCSTCATDCGACPAQSACLQRANRTVLSGAYTSQFNGTPPNGSTVDARGATWTMTDGWLATPGGGTDVCWVGGDLQLTVNDTSMTPTDAWSIIWHHNGGFTTKNSNANWIFDSVRVHHVGDAFNLSDGTTNFTIRDSHLWDVHDDCVQNDFMNGGSIRDTFFDGCYVALSARATGAAPDGHLNTWSIDHNLVWVKPTYSVYKGDSPGNGQIVKWEMALPQNAPHLVFKNNMVRVGKAPFQVGATGSEPFFFPPGCDFANNVLVWDGAGAPPASLTNWFNAAHSSRTGTLAEWDAAVTAWRAAHPGL